MENIRAKQEQLYEKWITARNYPYFVRDGILDYEKWAKTHPKILFLLKETADDFVFIADQKIDITRGNGSHFWWNICYWKYLINCFSEKSEPQFISTKELPEIKFNQNILDSIAYVNIKKQCDNRTRSNDSEIYGYAVRDCEFLKNQIDMIAPNIIFCTKVTFKSYSYIYKEQIDSLSELCFRHDNRLIINFKHPSFFQIKGGRETLFNILKIDLSILVNNKQFESILTART